MNALFALLIVGAVAFGAGGVLMLSQATLGVGLICVGCLSGILARIVQATVDHQQILERLRATETPPIGPINQGRQTDREPSAAEIRCRHCGAIAMRGPSKCQACGEFYR